MSCGGGCFMKVLAWSLVMKMQNISMFRIKWGWLFFAVSVCVYSQCLFSVKCKSFSLQSVSMVSHSIQSVSMFSHSIQSVSMFSRSIQSVSMFSRSIQSVSMFSHSIQSVSMFSRSVQSVSMVSHSIQSVSMCSHSIQSVSKCSHSIQFPLFKVIPNSQCQCWASFSVVSVKCQSHFSLRFIRSVGIVDMVSSRKFLEAAQNTEDNLLFYTVFKFFEQRNLRLRANPRFQPGRLI